MCIWYLFRSAEPAAINSVSFRADTASRTVVTQFSRRARVREREMFSCASVLSSISVIHSKQRAGHWRGRRRVMDWGLARPGCRDRTGTIEMFGGASA